MAANKVGDLYRHDLEEVPLQLSLTTDVALW